LITMKEEFIGCDKFQRAYELGGGDAIVLWLALKRYTGEHATDGFVPDDDIDKLIGAPKRPRRLISALVDCGRRDKSGVRGAGLVEVLEHGLQLHDYDDHAVSSSEIELRREKARVKKRAQRAAAAAELARLKQATPAGTNGGRPGDSPGGHKIGTSGVGAPAHVRAHDTQPSPAQPNLSKSPEGGTGESLSERAKLWRRDPTTASYQFPNPESWPELRGLCDLLAAIFGGQPEYPRNSGDPRCRVVLDRLASDIPLSRLTAAIRGSKHVDYIREKPENQTLMTILRDDAQVDKFAKFSPTPAISTAPARPAQPDCRPIPAPVPKPLDPEVQRMLAEAHEKLSRRPRLAVAPAPDPEPDRPTSGVVEPALGVIGG
jgi:hypothetical protein